MEEPKKRRHLPQRWMRAKKIGSIINTNIITCKTPLDSRFTPPYKREYWTPADLLRSSSLEGKKIGLVIDLTLSMEYYNGKEEFESKGIRYEKFKLMGNGCNVPEEAVRQCTKLMNDFLKTHPEHLCVIHCTHGYNRTGLIVCAYLNEYCGMSLNEAVALFKKKRPHGIYREEILAQLEVLCHEELTAENKAVSKPYYDCLLKTCIESNYNMNI